jgi:hypothetical protein
MTVIDAFAATIVCNNEDGCYDKVQVIADSPWSANYDVRQLARGDGWVSYAGTNGGTFHRCPLHRDEVQCTDDCASDCLGYAFNHQRPLARW